MDKATTIIGIDCSPRASSNSGRMLGEVLRSLERDRRVKVVEQVRLADERIDCLGCEQCYQTFGYHGDGIDRVLSLMKESDVILMATPTCFGMPPALGVVLLDRSDPLWRDGQQLKGKLGAVIVNGATDPADDPSVRLCADNMIKFFWNSTRCPASSRSIWGERSRIPSNGFRTRSPPGRWAFSSNWLTRSGSGSGTGDTGTSLASSRGETRGAQT
jgi:multimeric flavodoxin WrbA